MRALPFFVAAVFSFTACQTTAAILDAGLDGGTVDSGSPDAGSPDAGAVDAGATDAGASDAGAMDAGATDAGAMDGGVDAGSDAGGCLTGCVPTYIKASNTNPDDTFGNSVALSADGSTLAVGAIGEFATTRGAGDVHVFVRSGGTWVQQAYLKGSNTEMLDYFGWAVSLSADGATLAVGAYFEASGATGVDGDPSDNSAPRAGAVYVFTRSAGSWSQQAYLKASNTDAHDGFGYAVSLSADGATLAVGAPFESSSATGVNGDQVDNAAGNSGAAYVFQRTGATWSQETYLKASNTDVEDQFGYAVSLSGDGATLAVGAPHESSGATGVGGDQADNSVAQSGAAYVFTRSATTWSQQAYIKASNPGPGDSLGYSIGLSADGATLAVAAPGESSIATGIDGDQTDDSAPLAGAVYVFGRTVALWSQQAYVKASNAESIDAFGRALALSADGATLAVGSPNESSSATGINGNQLDNSANGSGAVYVLKFAVSGWSQTEYVKASNTGFDDVFGYAVSLSGDGATMAVGALFEDSGATGINGDQTDNSSQNSGAVYVY